MRAARVDQNQSEIVDALRRVGCSVQDLHEVGQGCPDLLVGVPSYYTMIDPENGERFMVNASHNILLEVKSAHGKLNEREAAWHADWRGQVCIVRSVDEALAAVGILP